jgi:hypothetical protein
MPPGNSNYDFDEDGMGSFKGILATIVIAGAFTLPVSADVVELKGGERIEGSFKSANAKGVSVEVGGQIVVIDRSRVSAIYLGPAPKVQSLLPTVSPLRAEALRALKSLQSAVASGINLRDFAPRSTDAKIVIDRYISEDQSDLPAMKTTIKAAMGYFILTAKAWSASVFHTGNGDEVARDPLVKECPSAMAAIETLRSRGGIGMSSLSQDARDGIALTVSYSSFLPCADSRIAEADRLAGVK